MAECKFDCPLFNSESIGVVCPVQDISEISSALAYCAQVSEFRGSQAPPKRLTRRPVIQHVGNPLTTSPVSLGSKSIKFPVE